MSWKKNFSAVNNSGLPWNLVGQPRLTGDSPMGMASNSKLATWLPEIYAGPPNRIMRYMQYEQMDQDSEIGSALDIIAEFATQSDKTTETPFEINYTASPGEIESEILNDTLIKWVKLNKLNKRSFRIFRNTVKYGDQFFIRDPQTYELFWVDPANIEKVIVDETNGKKIKTYLIKNLAPNFGEMTITEPSGLKNRPYGAGSGFTGTMMPTNASNSGSASYITGVGSETGIPILAKHVIHISLTEGMDTAWPFGVSILESVYKVFKQKELLEDSIIIYRVHRAPERRVFFIDVGNMPAHKSRQYLEQVKYEVQQKHVPNKNAAGQSIMDSAYNPMSMLEDYFFTQTCLSLETKIPLLDGRELTLHEIIDEYNDGKVNYTYSQAPDMTLEPGKIVWAGVTRENTDVVRVHLDNGEYIDATPDHRFIMRDGTEIEAQDLKETDSLMPLYLTAAKTSAKQKGTPYLRYKCNATEKIKWVHTSICPKSVPGKEFEIHHVDFNSKNNNPDNLVEMKTEEQKGKENISPDDGSLNKIVAIGGYLSWGDFKQQMTGVKSKYSQYNHKVVRVELLEHTMDTGDITVETPSGSHIFATSAGVYVHNSDGRGSKVETLPGGENLGQIDDLKFWNNKLLRGLKVPSSYLPTGPEDGTAAHQDGKVGVAYIQEYMFSTYLQRLQRQIEESLDHEFKMYLKYKGIDIDNADFSLGFTTPMNFNSYRDLAIDAERTGLYGSVADDPTLSARFKLKKYLQLTEDEIKENEKLWREEHDIEQYSNESDEQANLRSMGVRADPDEYAAGELEADDLADMDTFDELDSEDELNTSSDIPQPKNTLGAEQF